MQPPAIDNCPTDNLLYELRAVASRKIHDKFWQALLLLFLEWFDKFNSHKMHVSFTDLINPENNNYINF
jgi:hypothetical protein